MTVYAITNKVNNHLYIGLTKRPLHKRYLEHLRKAEQGKGSRLHRAMRKHGIGNFSCVPIIRDSTLTYDELHDIEEYLINKFNSYWFGYNDTVGGKGFRFNRPKRGRKRVKK